MRAIEAILFEPVGCLAEFPAEPFLEIAARLTGRKKQVSRSGSRAYWHLLNLMETVAPAMPEALEFEAVDGASIYEDVAPALAELKAMGVGLFIASSLSNAAIVRFLEQGCMQEFFSGVWGRENSGGIKAQPLRCAVAGASLHPEHTVFLTDTAEGLKVAKSLGITSILMMNDPDEAQRLAMHNPSGGIVSLHELPDFIRLVAAENARVAAPK